MVVGEPRLSSISPSAGNTSPGIIGASAGQGQDETAEGYPRAGGAHQPGPAAAPGGRAPGHARAVQKGGGDGEDDGEACPCAGRRFGSVGVAVAEAEGGDQAEPQREG